MNDDAPPMTSDALSDGQEIVMIILQICSATLSVIGSSTIVFKIIRDRAQNGSTTPYDRIMLGLSSWDILASITWAISDFLLPSETSSNVWAFGNPTTCRAAGFLTQLSVSAWWYNSILSFYFLLTVLSQALLKNLVRKFELMMHLSVLFFPITAIMGLRRGWYGLDNGECYLTDEVDDLIHWICVGIPTSVVYLSLIINNIMIYAVVRKSLRLSEHVNDFTSAQKRLKREAATLMFLYFGCFFVTVTPIFVKEILDGYYGYTNDNANKIYPLLVLDAMLRPLQGFFNFFIYIKPMSTRFRATNPNESTFFVVHQALFDPNVPQLPSPSELSITATNPNQALFNSNFRPPSSSSNSDSSSDEEGVSELKSEEKE